MLRVRDVMREELPDRRPRRADARGRPDDGADDLDLMPIVDDDGALSGVMTERALARRYIRESREAYEPRRRADHRRRRSSRSLEGELVEGEPTARSAAASGCSRWTSTRCRRDRRGRRRRRRQPRRRPAPRDRARRRAAGHEQRHAPADECSRSRASAAPPSSSRRWTATSPAAWSRCRRPARADGPRAADRRARRPASRRRRRRSRTSTTAPRSRSTRAQPPIGLVTRADLVDPEPRRVLLVDHAEQAQSVPGVEQAEIVEILDHHHIGSIETRVPVPATFDPVGSTATLVVERFRQNGMEPSARPRRCCSARSSRTR